MARSSASVAADQRAQIQAELNRRARQRRGYCPDTKPHPKQEAFIKLDCLEALYGGAAGGGKSTALLKTALRFCSEPKFAALIVRRTHKELIKAGALMDRAHDWWDNTDADWSAADKRWTFPSGATIEFGYFDSWGDRDQYQSAQWNLICFDELTHFPEQFYTFLFTRIRRAQNSKIPSMMRGATNPGNIGHEWVMRRFMTDVHPDRQFIPAGFRDNPGIDHDDYEKTLALTDSITQRQMLGEWIHDGTGLVYKEFQLSRNIIDRAPKCAYHILGLDFGIVDDNAVTVLGWNDNDPTIYVLESYRKKALVGEMALEVKRLMQQYDPVRIVGDVGGQGKAFSEEMRQRHHIPIEPAEKTNKLGYVRLLNDDYSRTRVRVVPSTCKDLIDEYKELYWDETGQKEVTTALNHASDSMLYGWRAVTAYAEAPIEPAARGSLIEQSRNVVIAHKKQWDSMPKEDQEIWSRQDDQSNKKDWWNDGY